MKTLRLLGLALVAILLCVNFTSCSKSDDDDPAEETPSLVGTWNWSADSNIPYPGNLEFEANGKAVFNHTLNGATETFNGTYTLTKASDGYNLKVDLSEEWGYYMEGTITISGTTAYYKFYWHYGTGEQAGNEMKIMTLTKQ